ncbi:glycosyltransferase, partial [Streptomyces sp. NPDC048845]
GEVDHRRLGGGVEAVLGAAPPPATRFLTAGLLTNYSGGRDGGRVGRHRGVPGSWAVLRGELEREPPALIVDDSRGKPYGPPLRPLLRAHRYERAGAVDGAVLYTRPGG